MVLSLQYSWFFYYMYKLFGTPINQLTVTQTIFLYKRIFSYNRIVDENGLQTGIVTPKSLCSTVLLSPDDGDIYFNDWFVKFTRNNCAIQEGAPLLYTRDTATKYKGEDVFSYSLVLNKKKIKIIQLHMEYILRLETILIYYL